MMFCSLLNVRRPDHECGQIINILIYRGSSV